jgi:hypothetical protein
VFLEPQIDGILRRLAANDGEVPVTEGGFKLVSGVAMKVLLVHSICIRMKMAWQGCAKGEGPPLQVELVRESHESCRQRNQTLHYTLLRTLPSL